MRLDELEIGKDAVVAQVSSDDAALHQHILDMGLTPGTEVTMVKYAPMGDPLELRLRGYEGSTSESASDGGSMSNSFVDDVLSAYSADIEALRDACHPKGIKFMGARR